MWAGQLVSFRGVRVVRPGGPAVGAVAAGRNVAGPGEGAVEGVFGGVADGPGDGADGLVGVAEADGGQVHAPAGQVGSGGMVQSRPGWVCRTARAGPATGSVSALSQDAVRAWAGAVSSQDRSSWTSRMSTMRLRTAAAPGWGWLISWASSRSVVSRAVPAWRAGMCSMSGSRVSSGTVVAGSWS